jgi:hypothetical protein
MSFSSAQVYVHYILLASHAVVVDQSVVPRHKSLSSSSPASDRQRNPAAACVRAGGHVICKPHKYRVADTDLRHESWLISPKSWLSCHPWKVLPHHHRYFSNQLLRSEAGRRRRWLIFITGARLLRTWMIGAHYAL